jgi:uncharacterized protein
MNSAYIRKIFVFLLILAALLFYKLDISNYREGQHQNSLDGLIGRLRSDYDREITIDGKIIKVEVVSDSAELGRGLSGRKSIGKNQGMLFDFGYPNTYPAFWMKDMNFAIDIIWINDNKIVGIERDVQPGLNTPDSRLKTYRPPTAIDYVLEVRSGFSDENNISVGDAVDLSDAINTTQE